MKAAQIIFFTSSVVLFSCNDSIKSKLDSNLINNPNQPGTENIDYNNLPTLEFDTTEHDFGAIKEGSRPQYVFHFKNKGVAGLIISDVHPSCGCTTPSWPHDVIKPDGEGDINVEFNSTGKSGEFRKTIMVTANTFPNKTVLVITGTVYPK